MRPGKYIATVQSHQLTNSKAGTWGVLVNFTVDEEEISGTIWLTGKAMGIARKSLKAIGFDPDTENISILNLDHGHLTGHQCEIDVQEETYQGVERLKIAWINPLPRELTDDDAMTLTESLRNAKHPDEVRIDEPPAEPEQPPIESSTSDSQRMFDGEAGVEG